MADELERPRCEPIRVRHPRLVPRQVTLVMFTASQGRHSQGRTTKEVTSTFEAEDTASGVPGRRERGKRCVTGH